MGELKLASEFPHISREDWQALVEASLKGRLFDSLISKTADNITIEPAYQRAEQAEQAAQLNPSARENPETWTLTQRADMPDIAAANAQMLDDLQNGATGISLVLPQTVSASSAGVAIRDARSIERLFEGIELDMISLRLDGGRNGRDLALLILDEYKRRRLDLARCTLNLGLDPLGAFAHGGRLTERSELTRRFGDIFRTVSDMDHQGTVAQADTRIYHDAGCSEAQELGLGLATAVDYMRMLEEAGISLAEAAPRIAMLMTADADQFLSLAKLRAARLLWARMLEVSGLAHSSLSLHVENAQRMMSQRDCHVNMLRTTTACFAAGIAGADSVTCLPFTHAVGLPDGFARRMSRNLQNLLLEETRAGRVIDAAAGSGHVETLTHHLAETAWSIFQSIEQAGGMMQALISGLPQQMISETRQARDKDIARRKIALTGVSEFPNLAEAESTTLDMKVPDDWVIGEPWPGQMETCEPLQQHRLAEGFEALRDKSDEHLDSTGKRPTVYLATLGSPADFTVRAAWISNLLAAGGIEAITGPADEFKASGLTVACICSSDDVYASDAENAAKTLGQNGATHIMLAGKPGDLEAPLSAAGVARFLHAGQDMLKLLTQLQTTITGETA